MEIVIESWCSENPPCRDHNSRYKSVEAKGLKAGLKWKFGEGSAHLPTSLDRGSILRGALTMDLFASKRITRFVTNISRSVSKSDVYKELERCKKYQLRCGSEITTPMSGHELVADVVES
ncbi:hypothetical protein TNCV_4040411 [Trichonephila clavipes]|nr:hypothetical protein TNCV_4040411 [Trichonephila clavipes]